MSRARRGNIWLSCFAISFAGASLLYRGAARVDLSPPLLLTAGMVGGTILCLPFSLPRFAKTKLQWNARHTIDLAVLIGIGTVLPFWLQMEGLRRTTATKGGIIMSLIPVLTTMFSRLILDRKATRHLLIRVLGMTGGGVLISWEGGIGQLNTGDWMIFGTAGCLALASVIAHRLLQHWPILIVVQFRLSLGLLILLPFVFSTFSNSSWSHPYLPSFGIATGILMPIFVVSIYRGIQLMGPEYAVLYDVVAALITALGAYILWGEVLSSIQWVGAFLILGICLNLFFADDQTQPL